MAELVDAPASGAGARKGVEVRVLFWAPYSRPPTASRLALAHLLVSAPNVGMFVGILREPPELLARLCWRLVASRASGDGKQQASDDRRAQNLSGHRGFPPSIWVIPAMTLRVNVHNPDAVCAVASPPTMAITMAPPAVTVVPLAAPVHLADDSRRLGSRSKVDRA